jgi:hypothetical protein
MQGHSHQQDAGYATSEYSHTDQFGHVKQGSLFNREFHFEFP